MLTAERDNKIGNEEGKEIWDLGREKARRWWQMEWRHEVGITEVETLAIEVGAVGKWVPGPTRKDGCSEIGFQI